MKEIAVEDIMDMVDSLLHTKENETQLYYEMLSTLLVAGNRILEEVEFARTDSAWDEAQKACDKFRKITEKIKGDLYTFGDE